MGSLGMQEIIVIFLIALIIFGPRKLPEIGKTIGKGLAEFKKASNELKQTWEDEVRLDKEKETVAETVAVPEPVKETTIQDTTIQPSEVLNENKTPAESKENQ
jgi:TatA/E family protein of Tat protein translocase